MALDFPASPTVGQQFSAAGVTWVWDGQKWAASGLSVAYLPLAGGTMSGPIVLAADPAAALQAATKQYVDGGRLGDNRVVNGDMRIDQRNGGASAAGNNVYTVDRWKYAANQTAKITWGRNLNAASGPVGFPYYLGAQSSSAYTPAASDQFNLYQCVEADMISDFAWGTANAQPVTLSFWVCSSLTGTFSGALQNYSGNRSYPFTFSLPTANIWTRIIVTVPGDTAGTWVMSGSAGSLFVHFDIGCGASLRGPPNVWAAAYYSGATGSVQITPTNGATFYVTGVKLEIGSVATPFNRQSLAKSLADCQRYYQVSPYLYGFAASATSISVLWPLKVDMRAMATISLVGGALSGESPPLGTSRTASGATITASHSSASASAFDFTIGGFTGLTAFAPASILPGWVLASAEL